MSGYTNNYVNENGEQFIPASQRPDGTWRKARRVKEGYVPQEEVPLYESKGKQFMNKKQEPVTLPSGQTARMTIPGLFIVEDDKEKKPAKKKNKKKVEELSNNLDNLKLAADKPSESKPSKKSVQNNANKASTPATAESTDPQKKLKNLKKRLREIEALEEKMKNGSLAKPEPDQLAKLKRKNDLLLQIRELEKSMN